MIDSHCHLTYDQLSGQLEAVLERAAAAGVVGMVTIGTSVGDAKRAVELCRKHSQVRCAIGVHPHHAGEMAAGDIEELEMLQRNAEVVALGEMGLDYHYDFSPRGRQKEVFVAQLELARKVNRPVVIHCREAVEDCLGIMKDFPGVSAVFHCFTGSAAEARAILDRGYYLGFTGVVTFKRSEELREVVRFTPGDRVMVETDAPYLSPEPFRKQKVNEPALVRYTLERVAEVRGVSVEEMDRVTEENTRRFYRWDQRL
jgi:TatD DNase family protein